MATIARLEKMGTLKRWSVPLPHRERHIRSIYGTPTATNWIVSAIKETPRYGTGGTLSPREDFYNMLIEYICGRKFDEYEKLHTILPLPSDVWEMKSKLYRFIGWFYKPAEFIVAVSETEKRCKDHDLYLGLRRETERIRDKMDLDLPKSVTGDYRDVLLTF